MESLLLNQQISLGENGLFAGNRLPLLQAFEPLQPKLAPLRQPSFLLDSAAPSIPPPSQVIQLGLTLEDLMYMALNPLPDRQLSIPQPLPCSPPSPLMAVAKPEAVRPQASEECADMVEEADEEEEEGDGETLDKRARHSIACKSKSKLTLAEKLEMIRLRDELQVSQAYLAYRFGKSRSAVSKILRVENIAKLKALAGAGVHRSIRRCSSNHDSVLEQRVHEFVENNLHIEKRRVMIRDYAQTVATQMGLSNFKATRSWIGRFMKRHGFK
ncbi:hypothetical protein GUITHDRAFT_110357 [Guillardia theta CCMP2712]|uniref:HTH CENPB-type domain-containing protein n=1 Tax=Guillardia theta (strain CCMP2712) TaxID=905079 RepID=L1J4W5_GUITC|nr:hypothetical protein GUITHDRAFT_110357 [Guillardia theta CCMP2712]EKX43551.1 hypothetical protein GUITHDRAFT_110357 [Guillardia theta CCMP2712]|eukprot:XP_005830531.1 hypothetical protein GUITHDRAFT_110357 [Guillardia theta CCMP2712]